MSTYPEVVAKIVDDYMERLSRQLRMVPRHEQQEFLGEIRSHLYEAYHQAPGEDDVARILTVLRNLGEPGEVVSERFPGVMIRAGAKRNLPLYILGGILIALFGLPLGFAGAGALVGALVALVGVIAGYYAVAASMLLVGTILMLLGVIRVNAPEVWDKLVTSGFIHMHPEFAEVFDLLSPGGQGFLLIVLAVAFAATGLAMLWLGKHLVRGTRFLLNLIWDWLRQAAQSVRRKVRRAAETPGFGNVSLSQRPNATP